MTTKTAFVPSDDPGIDKEVKLLAEAGVEEMDCTSLKKVWAALKAKDKVLYLSQRSAITLREVQVCLPREGPPWLMIKSTQNSVFEVAATSTPVYLSPAQQIELGIELIANATRHEVDTDACTGMPERLEEAARSLRGYDDTVGGNYRHK